MTTLITGMPNMPDRCLIRALVGPLLVLAALLLGGCGGIKGQGYLFTEGGKPLRLNEEVTLTQGHMKLVFDPEPGLWSRLRLHNERVDFSTPVDDEAYAGNGFFLRSQDSGLAYDIRASWREERGPLTERDSQEACTTEGYCRKQVVRLVCYRKSYRPGTERYEEHLDDDNCVQEPMYVTDYFPDCPGTRQVRTRNRQYQLLVSVDFLEPRAERPPVAVFDGQSRPRERELKVLSEGRCLIR